MTKHILLILKDQEAKDLVRILVDADAKAALAFLDRHFMQRTCELLSGG